MSIFLTLQRLKSKFYGQQTKIDTIPEIKESIDNSNKTAIEALKTAENAVTIAKESKEAAENLKKETEKMKEDIKMN